MSHSPSKRNNIILIGFSTTGKSKVAREVAKRLGWEFVDTDDEIVRVSGKSIPEIFAQEGEEKFRQLERKVLKKVCRQQKTVIASGGGAILNPKNRELFHKSGIVVCLEAKPETIYQRLLWDTQYSANPVVRPLLSGDNPLERIKNLKATRQLYYAIADWTVHTDNLTLDEVSNEVVKGWEYLSHYFSEAKPSSPMAELAAEVRTATERYPIFVGWGLLTKLGEKMRQAGLSGVANIISDETVFSIYGEKLTATLKEARFKVNSFTVPPGEKSKDIETATRIYDFLIKSRVERNDSIIALGGGMVGDLAGFVAATFLRGLPLIQVPTSLTAMVDASIGGKVAVNHPQGKNLIGAFYQPRLVLAAVETLTTLPRRELFSGWSEVIKHGLILDSSFFEFLENEANNLLTLVPNTITKAIAWSAALKAQVVTEDEKETGKRIILNYGHTIAHALEAATSYERLLHGEAVAIGMLGEAMLSQRLGLLSPDAVTRLRALLEKFQLPVSCPEVNLDALLKAMELDKKTRQKTIRWVLLEDIGKVVIRQDVSVKDVTAVLELLTKA